MTDQPPRDSGRLSAHELDALLGAPDSTSPGQPERPVGETSQADLLTGGADRPSLLERAAAAARRHPLLTWGTVVVTAAAGCGLWAYAATRPPPVATTIAAQVVFGRGFDPPPGQAISDGQLLHTEIQVAAAVGTPPVRATALLGPGLTDAAVDQRGAHVLTTNRLDCRLLPDLTAAGPYLLRLVQTDEWGREVSADVPLAERAALDVRQRVQQAGRDAAVACLAAAADQLVLLDLSTGRPGSQPAAASVLMTVHNPTAHDLWLPWGYAPLGRTDTSLRPTPGTALVPAGGTRQVTLVPTTTDCYRVPAYRPTAPLFRSPGRRAGNFALGVEPARGWSEASGWAEGTALELTEPQRRQVWSAVTSPCAGAPQVRHSVTQARSPSSYPPRILLTLQVGTERGSVDLGAAGGDPAAPGSPDAGAGTVRPVAPEQVADPAPAGSVRLVWRLRDCESIHGSEPPSYPVVVRWDGREFPFLLPLEGPGLRRVLAQTCGARPGTDSSDG